MPESARVVMLGTGDFALPTFELLADDGPGLVALVTQPDRPQGRKQEIIAAAIKQAAVRRGIPVFQPENVNGAESVTQMRGLAPDVLITAAYGQILSPELLAVPRLGGLNLHGSVLPAYRGAAPVARAIENGETETGVSVIQMTPRIDAGGVIAVARLAIDPDETAGELEGRLARLGAPLVKQALADLFGGRAVISPQDPSRATRAPKLRKDDSAIRWNRPARVVHNHIRAMQPWPGASTMLLRVDTPGIITRLIVLRSAVREGASDARPGSVIEADGDRIVVACNPGALALLRVQTPGARALDAAEFLRGRKISQGDQLRS